MGPEAERLLMEATIIKAACMIMRAGQRMPSCALSTVATYRPDRASTNENRR